MGSKTTSQVTNAANPDAQAAYNDVVGKAQGVGSTPYSPYTGELVAGLNSGQTSAIGQLRGAYGAAQPYIDQGTGYLGQGAQGLGAVGSYLQAGSDATAAAAGYQGLGSASFGQAGAYAGQSAAALAGMQPYMDQAQGAIGQAQGYFGQAAGLATPQDFDAAAVQKYMSPYLSSVVNATQANLEENDAQQSLRQTADDIGAGAYGGDRAAVGQAELARQQSLADGATIANLYNTGYSQAEGQFNAVQGQRQAGASLLAGLGQGSLATASGYNGLAQDQGQMAQQYGSLAGVANATGSGYAGLASNSLGQASAYGSLGQLQGTTGQAYGTLAGLAGNLGTTSQGALISGASAGLQGATLRQQDAQQQDTALYNQYMAGLSYPYQNVGFLSNIVQGIGSQEGNTQTTQGNALSSIAGLGTSAIGILGATGGFGANGYLSSIGSTFSDERVKENIAPIGQTFDGQTLYRYNYKGSDPRDVKTGLMAQDVEKRDPGAVGDVGGIKTVDYGRATAGAAALGLGARPGDPRPARATGGPVALGMSPAGGLTMPGAMPMGLGARPTALPALVTAGAGLGLGARPRFDDGGTVDAGAAIPTGGISFGGVPGSGASSLNTSPSALMGGSTVTAHAAQGLGALRSPLTTAGPTSPQNAGPVSFNGNGMAGLGDISFSGGSGDTGSTQDPSSAGFSPGAASGADGDDSAPKGLGAVSQNGWMGVLSAGLGIMSGTSMSGLANIGQGAQQGLQTYLGLERQDKQNAFQQQELALKRQTANSESTYRAGVLAQGDKTIELKAQEMQQAADRAQKELAIQSSNAATQASSVASENATRDQTRNISRYTTTFVPGQGWVTRDLTNPTAAPTITPYDPSGAAGQAAGAPISFGTPPSPTPASPTPSPASAPPPSGGVPASGSGGTPPASLNTTIPGSLAPVPALAAAQRPAPAPASGANAAPAPVQSGPVAAPAPAASGWQPTTTVPKGYVPPNQMAIYQNPGLLKGEQDNATKTIEGTRAEAQAAGGLQMRLDEMDRQFAQLPKTGLLAPGAAATARADIAKGINTFAASTGAAPPFDPNALAANENLLKDRFRLGADLAKSMGGREPGFIVEQAVRANPGADNTPLAYQRITAGLRAASQYQQDRASFFDDYNAKFGHLNGAQQAFDKMNPPQAYADRAVISTVDPRDVAALRGNASNPQAGAAIDKKYGAGTASTILRQ